METVPLVRMEGMSKAFERVRALEEVDLHVDRREILGLVGDNGAGKSTLIKILSGVHPADKGEIYFEGKRVHIADPMQARELGIETIYQDLALVDDLKIYRNIFLAREFKKRYLGIVRLLDEGKMKSEAEGVLKRLGIEIASTDDTVRTLSGGQKQCVALARSVYFDAKLLVMDEPTAALGVAESTLVLDMMRNLKEHGKSVIVITHNLAHIFSVCDRIMVLQHGRKVGERYTRDTSVDEITDMIIGRGQYASNSPKSAA